MKLNRSLLFVAAVCGLTLSAFGDPLDFRANVLDPPNSYPVTIINSTQFSMGFSACAAGELPNGLTADGCFAAQNDSGQTWTSLDIIFPDTSALGSQPASCAPDASNNIFGNTSCTLVNGFYILNFFSGSIPSGAGNQSIFFITETGVNPDDFPDGAVVAGVGTVPEPGSVLLLMTGMVLLGFVTAPRLRAISRG